MDAAKAAGCTDWERQHALDLLARWQTPDKALDYIAACKRQRDAVAAVHRCPYVGEF